MHFNKTQHLLPPAENPPKSGWTTHTYGPMMPHTSRPPLQPWNGTVPSMDFSSESTGQDGKLSSAGLKEGGFRIGKPVGCKPFGEVVAALGSRRGVAAIITEMNLRARKAFNKHSALPCAATPLKSHSTKHWLGGSLVGGTILAHHGWHPQGCQQHPTPADTPHDAPSAATGEQWEAWHVRT